MTAAPRRFTNADELLAGLDATPTAAADDGWEAPVPLRARRLLPPFPVDALPGWLATQVRAVAEFTQTPADVAGCVALAALSTAAGGRVVIEARPGWHEPVNLCTVVALPPGSRKSAVFAAMTAPLLAAERELAARTRPLIVQAELDQVAARQAERAATAAANAPTGASLNPLVEATDAALHADSITVPVLPRLVADDITPEAAASLLAEQGGRLAILSAEGGIFATMAGRYSGGTPNLEVLLKAHAGDLLRVDRKGRPAEHVERPALTLGLAFQPEVLTQIAAAPGFRGRGLLARLLYALPENTVGRRRVDPDPVPADVAAAYETNLAGLVHALATDGDPLHLVLDAGASRRVLDLAAAIEPQLDPAGDLGHVADWGSKFVGAVVRIAGLLHLADHRPQMWNLPLDEPTVEAATHIGHYFLAHALAAFDYMGADPVTEDAAYVLDRIVRAGWARFTKRELFNAVGRGRFPKVGDLDPILEMLDTLGHIRPDLEPARPGPRGGRPRSLTYDVHPQHHSAEPAEPAKPPSRRGFAGSAGSAEPSTPSDPMA